MHQINTTEGKFYYYLLINSEINMTKYIPEDFLMLTSNAKSEF